MKTSLAILEDIIILSFVPKTKLMRIVTRNNKTFIIIIIIIYSELSQTYGIVYSTQLATCCNCFYYISSRANPWQMFEKNVNNI